MEKAELGTVAGTSDPDWAAFASKQQVTSAFDQYLRPVRATRTGLDPASGTIRTYAVTQTGYDALGRPECVAVRMNPATWSSEPDACAATSAGADGPDRITHTDYDEVGRVATVASGWPADPVKEVRASYTDNGLIETLTDAEDNRTTYEYDGYDRLSKTRYPEPSAPLHSSTTDYEQLLYDDAGRVFVRRLRGWEGNHALAIVYDHDDLNRVTQMDLPGIQPDAAYAYDNLDRVTNADQVSGADDLAFGYDALSRLVSETGPLGTMASAWDAAGRRISLTWPDAFEIDYGYYTTGEMKRVAEHGAASGPGVLARYTYDDLGRRIDTARGNGTTTAYGWDGASRLVSLTQDLAGGGASTSGRRAVTSCRA